ncbi:MAG: hypothetical protein BWY82_02775 [Verrucomicrobia bacterium ADurb.Bin474]|nr:MAG: hypothetical protein BWY82_02775 [Verrucomicrobia bacterium ADurb.Bin474]
MYTATIANATNAKRNTTKPVSGNIAIMHATPTQNAETPYNTPSVCQ